MAVAAKANPIVFFMTLSFELADCCHCWRERGVQPYRLKEIRLAPAFALEREYPEKAVANKRGAAQRNRQAGRPGEIVGT
jgi:hypothetical protein